MAGLDVTRLDAEQYPPRPTFQQQGPDSNCMIDGRALGWSSCTAYAMAMAIDSVTGGTRRPSGCAVRRMTDPLDISGGLTLTQVAKVARDRYGLAFSVYVGSNVVPTSYLARQVRAGRPAVIQGNAAAMVGTKYQSTAGDVNHAAALVAVRGGSLDHPGEGLVYDPAADGRDRSYHVDQGPTWWDWDIVLRFIAYLRPNGPGALRLGYGRAYCAIGPDTVPRVTLVEGGRRARPFPDRVRAKDPNDPRTAIHSRPGGAATVTRYVPNGTLLRFYQYAGKWGVNDDGTEWVLLSNTSHVGGST